MSPDSRSAPDGHGPGSSRVPPQLALALTDPVQPVLLLVATDGDERAADLAVELATARAEQGLPTILADGGVAAPSLHARLDAQNLEGLADLFLYGASLARVSARPEGFDFDFVPAGAYVPDPEAVLDNPRWDRIAPELHVSGALLLLYVPVDTPGLRALSRRIGRAVLLGDDRQTMRMASRLDASCRVVASVEPASGQDDDVGSAPGPEPEHESGTDPDQGPLSLTGEPANAMVAAEQARQEGQAHEPDASDPVEPIDPLEPVEPVAEPSLDEPIVIRAEERSRRVPVGLLLLALAVAAAVGGWWAYQEYFAGPAAPVEAAEDARPRGPVARGQPMDTPIPISVAVEAHQDLAGATERVEALRAAAPGVDFYLAPVSVGGALYYRLYAGPAADADTGTALLQWLVDAGHKTAFDSWAVRPTELAFLLGEFDTRAEADARVRSLAEAEIPAYVVPLRYDRGADRYRVYGGAYESEAEAAVMQEMLENAGEESELLPRTGAPIR
jgi:hypothetical protein